MKEIIALQTEQLVHQGVDIVRKEIMRVGSDALLCRIDTESGVTITKQTLFNWINHKTRCPRLSKLAPVLMACGYKLTIGPK